MKKIRLFFSIVVILLIVLFIFIYIFLNNFEKEKIISDIEKKFEIKIIEKVASKINKSLDIDAIANTMLASMHEYFNFEHSMILLVDKNESTLKVIATFGYNDQGIGAEVKIGVGVIGMVAKKKKLMRL